MRFPVSVCNYLINGLDQRLVSIFCRNYPKYGQLHDMLAAFQLCRLPIILRAMQSAKEEVQTYTSIARNAIGGQAFHLDATTHPSQAEATLNRYSQPRAKGTNSGYSSNATNKSNTSLSCNDSCFGCGDRSHPWMQDKVILCPPKDRPGIKETAEKNYKDWLAKYKAHRKKRKEINFDNMSPHQQRRSPSRF
jgi:hypothetical protein